MFKGTGCDVFLPRNTLKLLS